jgi:uncharacterized protein (DUF2267 family)
MSITGLAPFDSTLHTTNAWLHELMNEMGWQDRHCAYQSMRAVLHALRDRLSVDQAAALGAQLPLLVRGIYYEGWHPHGKPLKERRKEEFLAHVAHEVRNPTVAPEQITRAMFRLLSRHVTAGEIEAVKRSLPGELRSLWLLRKPGTSPNDLVITDQETG